MNVTQPSPQSKRFGLNSIGDFLKKYWSAYLFLFLIGGIIIGLDQWTKVLVRATVPLGSDWLPAGLNWLMPYARIRYWYNSGAAFGIFQNGNLVFTILAILVTLLILYYYPLTVHEGWYLRLAMAMQFAGADGNLIDRLRFGHVTDFISVGNFAIFNISDASISVGVVVLILGVWWKEREDKRWAGAAAAQDDEAGGE
jgi:signal peptidase II